MKTIKKITSLVIMLTVFAVAAGQTFAAFEAINEKTGFDSINNVSAIGVDDFKKITTNNASIDEFGVSTANSGDEKTNHNTGIGETNTGKAIAVAGFINPVNVLDTVYVDTVYDKDWNSTLIAKNKRTGKKSENTAIAEVDNDVRVENENDADVKNRAFAKANTGRNKANGNTGTGIIDTGKATANVDIINSVNYNKTDAIINMADAKLGASNKITGKKSTNSAYAIVENDVRVINNNEAIKNWNEEWGGVINVGEAEANTGENSASGNTGAGEITTKAAKADTLIENGVNVNVAILDIDLGDAEITAENEKTGANSVENTAIAEVDNDVRVENENDADVKNRAFAKANTGRNKANGNTGTGIIDTGKATTFSFVSNGININDTEINIIGTDLKASNKITGARSTNIATASETNKVIVTNNNTADVKNTIHTESNTGGNTANGNTGAGSSTTGDATASFSSTNVVNNSTTIVGGNTP